jgi:hypothetical protein
MACRLSGMVDDEEVSSQLFHCFIWFKFVLALFKDRELIADFLLRSQATKISSIGKTYKECYYFYYKVVAQYLARNMK